MRSIQAATSSAAQLLGLDGEIGTISVGRCADIILVEGDPLTDLTRLARPVLVHRMALGFAARAEGQTLDELIGRIVGDVMGMEAAA